MPETVPDALETFDTFRPLLFGIAYRMVGSVMDAEDIVQETWLHWQHHDAAAVTSPRAFLSAVVTRRSIDHLRAAHTQRESYLGPWLPEPVVTEREGDMADTAALHESLSMAFLVLLETLTPTERAVFLLHDIFAYDFREIAEITGKNAANCRQIARRARHQIQERRPRFDPSPQRREQLTQQFIAACMDGDLSALLATLAEDAILWSDGGGKAHAAHRPIVGAYRVASLILGYLRHTPITYHTRRTVVNGQPGFAWLTDQGVGGVVTFDIIDARIHAVRIVTNPDKLQAASAALDDAQASRSAAADRA